MVAPGLRRSSDCAMVKVDLIIVSRGMTIRQNSTIKLTSTIMLNGFFSTFNMRFFSLVFVSGFLGRSFLDTVTPLSQYCRELCLGKFYTFLTSILVPPARTVISSRFVQTFALCYPNYKKFLLRLSMHMLAILSRHFYDKFTIHMQT